MSAPKFTPGSWEIDDQGDSFHVREEGGSKHVIAHINGAARSGHAVENCIDAIDEQRANAHLIAAAPELYAALRVMVDKAVRQNWNDNYPEQLAQARAALAKAVLS